MAAIALVVFHDEERTGLRGRLAALRGTSSGSLLFCAAGEVGAHVPPAHLFRGVRAAEPVYIVHLLDDHDGKALPGAPPRDASVLAEVQRVHDVLRSRLPLIDARSWVVLAAGPVLTDEELHFLTGLSKQEPVLGAVAITDSSGASLQYSDQEVVAQLADLIHTMTTTDLAPMLGASGCRVWALGVGSVVYLRNRYLAGAVLRMKDELRRPLEHRPRDPGLGKGKHWFNELNIGPPTPGEDRTDDFARLVLTGQEGGYLPEQPGAALRLRAAEIDRIDPGLWPGYLTTVLDAATAPTTAGGHRSPLQVALDNVDENVRAQAEAAESGLLGDARAYVADQRNLPSARAWAEGVLAAIADAQDTLNAVPRPDPADLRETLDRFRKAAGWLPYSGATAARGVMLVVIGLVLAYAYAPLHALVALLVGRQLPFFGDDAEANARLWARLVAVSLGILLWIRWESRWRRVRRWRRRFVEAADAHLAALVIDRMVQSRLNLLRQLTARIGAAGSSEETILGWLSRSETAVVALLDVADGQQSDALALAGGSWTTTVPSSDRTALAVDRLGEVELVAIERTPIDVIHRAPLGESADDLVAAMEARIEAFFPDVADGLDSHWRDGAELEDECVAVLNATLWPGLPQSVLSTHGVDRSHYIAATSASFDMVKARSTVHIDSIVASNDPCFVANLWVTPLAPAEVDRS